MKKINEVVLTEDDLDEIAVAVRRGKKARIDIRAGVDLGSVAVFSLARDAMEMLKVDEVVSSANGLKIRVTKI